MKTVVKHPEGVIVPLLTPVDANEDIHFEQLSKLVEHVIAGGVDGIFVMGTSGEASRFTMEERMRIIRAVAEQVNGRVPVYAGVSDCGARMVKKHITNAYLAGADAVVSTLPYYFPTTHEREMVDFFQSIADFSPLPVIIYNIPVAVGVSIPCRVIDQLYTHPNIVAIKDSSADAVLLEKLLVRYQSDAFAVLVGDEALLQSGFEKGVDGCVPSLANPFPRVLAALYHASKEGDSARLAQMCGVVSRFNQFNKYCDSWMSPNIWRKTALSMMGVMDDFFTAPYEPVSEAGKVKVAQRVEAYQAMIAAGEI